MRLRYLGPDYFEVASRSSSEGHLRNALRLPLVPSLSDKSDSLSELQGIYQQIILSGTSSMILVQLPEDSPYVEETSIYDKFLLEIFPGKLDRRSIDLGGDLSNSIHQHRFGREDQENDVESSRNNHPGETHPVDPKLISWDVVPDDRIVSWCTDHGSFRMQVKTQEESEFFESKRPEFRPFKLELPMLWKCILDYELLSPMSLLARTASCAVESGAVSASEVQFKVSWPQKWFDITPRCSTECDIYCPSATEPQLNGIQEKRRFCETSISWQFPDNAMVNVVPLEIPKIEEELSILHTSPRNTMTYAGMPGCLLSILPRIQSQDSTVEKGGENIVTGCFTADSSLVENVDISRQLLYQIDEFRRLEMPFSELLFDGCDLQSNRSLGIQPKGFVSCKPFHALHFVFEIPGTYERNLCSYKFLDPGDIAADSRHKLVNDLDEMHPSECFETVVLIPELRLDDLKFRSLPLPGSIYKEGNMFDESLARFICCCEPATFPATNWLYLDWDIFHGAKCTDAAWFGLRAQLIDKDQCGTPASLCPTKFVSSRSLCSEVVLMLKQLDVDDHRQDTGFRLHSTLTKGWEIELLSYCPPVNFSSMQPGFPDRGGPQERGNNIHPLKDKEGSYLADPDCELNLELPNCRLVKRFITTRPGSIEYVSDFISSDLDYFIQARKGLSGNTDEINRKEGKGTTSKFTPDLPNVSQSKSALLTGHASDQDLDLATTAAFCEHNVHLPMEIRKCIVSLASNYYSLLGLEEITETKIHEDVKFPKEFGFDADGNGYLSSLISRVASEEATCQRQMLLKCLTALHVLRHTAFNLCNYGIQVAYLYLENFCERTNFLEGFIIAARIELEDAYNQVERGAVEDHPKLYHIDQILRPITTEIRQMKRSNKKILLVADKRVFFTLFRKLASLGLRPYQIDRREKYLQNGVLSVDNMDKLKEEILETLTFSDCLLVSNAYMNPSFPVEKFTMVIQYADSPHTPGLNYHWTSGCEGHVFKLRMHPKEFETGFFSSSGHRKDSCQFSQATHSTGITQPLQTGPEFSHARKLPVTGNRKGLGCLDVQNRDDEGEPQTNLSKQALSSIEHKLDVMPPIGGIEEQLEEDDQSLGRQYDMIIVANICHPNEHTLTCRRSSYKKILCLEKENVQVVERELRLPIDLILSPACCLIVYTLQKLGVEGQEIKYKQNSFQNEVDTHMKAIGFSFRNCILIFEGPTEFTSIALDMLTHFYALALALKIHIQCFLSRHVEVTDVIILRSIETARRSKQMLTYPVMTEGATLAEAFLTEFPSINPLTAHAILSSGLPLPAFLSLDHQQQFAALEGYGVPKHCLELFEVQCTYKPVNNSLMSSGCQRVHKLTNPNDRGIEYLVQEERPGLSTLTSETRPRHEVWSVSLASKGSYNPPDYEVRNNSISYSFPDFPPASEVGGDKVDISEEGEYFSTDPYGALGVERPGLSTLTSETRPRHEVWSVSLASKGSYNPPDYEVRNNSISYSFPDFPPPSEVGGDKVDLSEEGEYFSTDPYGALGVCDHQPADPDVAGVHCARWIVENSETRSESMQLGAARNFNRTKDIVNQSPHVVEGIRWANKRLRPGDDSKELGSMPDNYMARNVFQLSEPAAYLGAASQNPPPLSVRWPLRRSAFVHGSNCFDGPEEDFYQGHELFPGSAEISGLERTPWHPRSSVSRDSKYSGMKRGVSTSSLMTPTINDGRQGTGLNGDGRDHKRARGGVSEGFIDESFNIINVDARLTSASPATSVCLDEFFPPHEGWGEAPPVAHLQENSLYRLCQPRGQTLLKPSSLDRFRYRRRSPASAHGAEQTKLNLPTIAPIGKRIKSATVTNTRPTSLKKSAGAITIVGEHAKTLGYAKRGSDTQRHLVWKNNTSLTSW